MTEAKKKKILIIEDEESLIELLSAKLIKEGYDVMMSGDGEKGLEDIKNLKPDLILLDILMPNLNGYEVLEKMNELSIKIPVIIISNSGQPVEIEKTKKLGAVDHLIKTEFSPADVLEKVQAFLGVDGQAPKSQAEKAAVAPIESADGKKLGVKVLLVEDDSFLREICSKKLVKEGYSVYEAVDGEQAIQYVNEVEPDIVLLDIILPALDGFQILAQIKASKDQKVKNVPVIMLSNLGQDDDIKKAMDMGAKDYLVKAHFTTEEIVGKIKGILGK